MKKTFNLVATAAAGLEAVVGREIRDLGIDCQVENGKVRFQGDIRTIITTNHLAPCGRPCQNCCWGISSTYL